MSKEFSQLNGYGVKDAVARAEIEQLKQRYKHSVSCWIESENSEEFLIDIVCDKATAFTDINEAIKYAKNENMPLVYDTYGFRLLVTGDFPVIPEDNTRYMDSISITFIDLMNGQVVHSEVSAGDALVYVRFDDTVTEI